MLINANELRNEVLQYLNNSEPIKKINDTILKFAGRGFTKISYTGSMGNLPIDSVVYYYTSLGYSIKQSRSTPDSDYYLSISWE